MKTVLIFSIKLYQRILSPSAGWLRFLYLTPIFNLNAGALLGCRFKPTCSEYAINSIKKYGSVVGLVKTCRRLARCI